MSHTRRAGAFTLIELLVVISIIALLVGILLPALGKRVAALQVIDLSNQRQTGIAMAAYAAEANGYAPARGSVSNAQAPLGDIAGLNLFGTYGNPVDKIFPNAEAVGAGEAMGLGVLVPAGPLADVSSEVQSASQLGNFLTIDTLFSPSEQQAERADYEGFGTFNSFFALRDYYGDQYTGTGVTWSKVDPLRPGTYAWGPLMGGANYNFFCSYTYRGADYSIYDPSINASRVVSYQEANGLGGGGLPNATTIAANRVRATTEHPDFSDNVVMMNGWLDQLDANQRAVHVLIGDGSAQLLNDEAWLNLIDPKPAPVNNWYNGGAQWMGVPLKSAEFGTADFVLGN